MRVWKEFAMPRRRTSTMEDVATPGGGRGVPTQVVRAALVERLLASRARVVVVAAPPGYGKTTLLRQTAARAGRGVAYSLLDSRANDPAVLFSTLTAAITAPGMQALADPASRGDLERAALEWVNRVASRGPLLIQIDDVHTVTESSARAMLEMLVRAASSQVRFMLASRGQPPLALSRLRAAGEVEQIGIRDLAFSLTEATELAGLLGGHLDRRTVRRLWTATEGWAAGLQLATLAAAGGGGPTEAVEAVVASRGPLAEFVLEEVVSREPADARRFLLDTAILDRLVPELCDAVRESSDSAAQLDRLTRRQLFVPRAARRRGGVQHYSRLFRDVLRGELDRGGRPRVQALHQRAAAWYASHDDPVAQITHMLLAAHSMALLTRGQLATVQRSIDAFGAHELRRSAPLALTAAWAAVFRGQPANALRHATFAERAEWVGELPDGTASVASAVAILRSSVCTGTLEEARALAERSIELEPELSPWRPSGHLQLGTILLMAGDVDRAEGEVERAAALGAAYQPAVHVSALAYVAHIASIRGDLRTAERIAGDVMTMIREGDLDRFPPIAFPCAVAGRIMVSAGRFSEAEQLLETALRLLASIAFVFAPADVWVRTVIAEGLLELGHSERARVVAADARRLLDRYPLDERLATRVQRLQVVLDERDRFHEPLTAREREILAMLVTVQSLQDIANQLVVSQNTVKTHVRRIYRKLDAPNRRLAVARARELGLIAPSTVEVARR
jgi:LuxR family transcriptional regulator, maltose regulon positive regulatory protein